MPDKDTFTYHLSKAFAELEHRIAERVVTCLSGNEEFPHEALGQERLLTAEQLSEYLQISISHFYSFKKKHKNLPVYNIGKNIRYKASEIENFIKSLNQSDGR